jgi:acyl-CoA thioesterase
MPSIDTWLGLEQAAPGRWSFELKPNLSRFDGALYGGTGLAVVTALAETETGQDALWATVQFVDSTPVGDRLDCRVEVLAQGRRTSQLRITASVGDRLVLNAMAATGTARAGGFELQIGHMPEVRPPEESPEWTPRVPFALSEGKRGWLDSVELRDPDGQEGGSGMPGRKLWARMRAATTSRATLGFVADLVPSSVVRAAGRAGGGRSLDNTLRFGPTPETEWVLVDLDPHFAYAGYVHGAARLWSEDTTLLGVASQTAVALLFD